MQPILKALFHLANTFSSTHISTLTLSSTFPTLADLKTIRTIHVADVPTEVQKVRQFV